MSRSYRKHLYIGNTANSDKWFKQKANRILRRLIKMGINQRLEVLPVIREVFDVWYMPKDGKHYFGGSLYQDKLTRK